MPEGSRAQPLTLLAFCFPRCAAGRELQPCLAEGGRAAGKGSSCCSTLCTLTFNTEPPLCCAGQAHALFQTPTGLQMMDQLDRKVVEGC